MRDIVIGLLIMSSSLWWIRHDYFAKRISKVCKPICLPAEMNESKSTQEVCACDLKTFYRNVQ